MLTKLTWKIPAQLKEFFQAGWVTLLTIIPALIIYFDQHKPGLIYGGLHPIWVEIISKSVFPSIIIIGCVPIWHSWKEYKFTRIQKEKAKLENDLQGFKEAHKKILLENLVLLSNKCSFGQKERVSVYIYAKNGFKLVGRYSKSNNLANQGRGGYYPLKGGVIANAWDTGESKICDLPDPETDLVSWCNKLNAKFGTPVETLKELSMKARSYYALRISHGHKNIAILVLEGLRPKAFNLTNLTQIKEHHIPQITAILENLDLESVALEYARKEGF